MPIANHFEENSDLTVLRGTADVHLGRRVGATVLVEEAELRGDRARERQHDSDVECHEIVSRVIARVCP
jgi:hypothetical protein